MSYEVVRLEEYTDLITCGVAKKPDYVDEGIPFLSSKNVKKDRFILNDYGFAKIFEEFDNCGIHYHFWGQV
jgi:type I restriction enzyme S subunit